MNAVCFMFSCVEYGRDGACEVRCDDAPQSRIMAQFNVEKSNKSATLKSPRDNVEKSMSNVKSSMSSPCQSK